MTVRARLAVWNVCVLAAALLMLGGLLHAKVRANLIAAVDRDLAGRGAPADFFFRMNPVRPIGPARAQKPPRGSPLDDDAFRPRLFGPEGRAWVDGSPEASYDRQALARAAATGRDVFTTVRLPGEAAPRRIYTHPSSARPGGAPAVLFQWSLSLAPVERDLAQLTGALVFLLPVALAVAALGGLFLTARALRPVRQIARAAERIGAANLSERLPVSGRDEFADLARTVNRMLGRLEDAFERQRRFTADASHELRTPLTVVKAHSSLALADPTLTDDARETLGAIDAAADRTIRMVGDLLLLARADAQELPLRCEPIGVEGLFAAVARDAARLETGGARVGCDIRPEGLALTGDRDHLHRMLLNLVENALRHTPADGSVTLSARRAHGDVLLAVTDTGEGIAPEHVARLGERFYRVEASRERARGGTGLGLSICRAIAQAHGGTLVVESQPGAGTTVTARLPQS